MSLLNLHVAVMQTWAWGSMLNDRIPEQGIEQALDTTFSGDFPCEKCRAIAEFKQNQNETQKDLPQPKLEELKPTYFIAQSSSPPSRKTNTLQAFGKLEDAFPRYSIVNSIPGPPPKLLV